MKTRTVTLVSRKAFTASDVIDKDLTGLGMISFIDIIVRMTNGAAMTEASVVKIQDDITGIKIVDGGNVLCNVNAEELQALNAFDYGAWPYENKTLEDAAVQLMAVRLPFGFFPYDPNHYLRPGDFENPKIEISITMTTAAATAWAASGHDVTILAGVMESGFGDYRGFLATKNVKSYSAVDGTREDIELNTDWPYRAILIQAFKTTTRPDENVEIVKLTANNDAHVELELYMTQLEAQNAMQFGPFRQKIAKRMKADSDTVLADFYLQTYATCGTGTTLYVSHVVNVDAESIVTGTFAQT